MSSFWGLPVGPEVRTLVFALQETQVPSLVPGTKILQLSQCQKKKKKKKRESLFHFIYDHFLQNSVHPSPPQFIWYFKMSPEDFPAGTVDKNSPANAGNTGSVPGPGRFHMLWGDEACEPQL